MIKTTSYDQIQILSDITNLYLRGDSFDLDPTYSKGKFYQSGDVQQPKLKSDLIPRFDDVRESCASSLWLEDNSIGSICFDPPFVAGHTKQKPTGIIGERFHGFRYVKDLWDWYDLCLAEFYRVLNTKGVLVFKCQDTVSSGKQYLSHVHIINEAEKLGFYCRDLFVLNAKSRIIGYSITFTANMLIFPLFGWDISVQQNLLIGVIYTLISFARSYLIRRFFNWWHK